MQLDQMHVCDEEMGAWSKKMAVALLHTRSEQILPSHCCTTDDSEGECVSGLVEHEQHQQ